MKQSRQTLKVSIDHPRAQELEELLNGDPTQLREALDKDDELWDLYFRWIQSPDADLLGDSAHPPAKAKKKRKTAKSDPADNYLRDDIEARKRWIRISRVAQQEYDAEASASAFQSLPRETLADLIARGIEPVSFLVAQLAPKGGNVLVPGPAKAGKTTLLINLADALINGTPFLGLYRAKKVSGRVGYWNYELSEEQFATWVQNLGIPADRIVPLNLRGRRWDLMNDYCFEDSVSWCRDMEIENLIIDPFSRAYVGDENDNSEVGRWTDRLDELKHEAGVEELFLSAHFGRSHEERARGAQRLEDWADVLWNYVAEWDSKTRQYRLDGYRFFAAFGRDVDHEWPDGESVVYDHQTHRLKLTGAGAGQSRGAVAADRKMQEAIEIVETYATEDEPMSQNAVADKMHGGREARYNTSAVKAARDQGHVNCKNGPNKSFLHWPKKKS